MFSKILVHGSNQISTNLVQISKKASNCTHFIHSSNKYATSNIIHIILLLALFYEIACVRWMNAHIRSYLNLFSIGFCTQFQLQHQPLIKLNFYIFLWRCWEPSEIVFFFYLTKYLSYFVVHIVIAFERTNVVDDLFSVYNFYNISAVIFSLYFIFAMFLLFRFLFPHRIHLACICQYDECTNDDCCVCMSFV